ncbi:hypothetical protein BGX27_001619, partial [Mortierella sp. AM989]
MDIVASPKYINQLAVAPEPHRTPGGGRRQSRGQGRQEITLERKDEVIQLWRQVQSNSITSFAKSCGMPRTTVYGIIKRHQSSDAGVQIQMASRKERFRNRKPRLPIVEEVLVSWIIYLRLHGEPDPAVCRVGRMVHDALTELLLNPQPPCQFSPSWLKGFMNRHSEDLQTEETSSSLSVRETLTDYSVKRLLSKYEPSDIFCCHLFGLFKSVSPATAIDSVRMQPQPPDGEFVSYVSFLLLCNAEGTKETPRVVRVSATAVQPIEGSGGETIRHNVNGPAQATFLNCLVLWNESISQ